MKLEIKSTKRVGILDEVRGLSIILMVIYHFIYDLVEIFGVRFSLFFSLGVNILRDIFAGIFILIAGICCNYSKNNLKRGLIVFGFGMGLFIVTAIFIPQEIIMFGILHLLGICMILYSLFERFIKRLKPLDLILICAILFFLTYNLQNGYFAFFKLPSRLFDYDFLFPIGITSYGFYSSDYFALMPWGFLFFLGSGVGVYFKASRLPKALYKTHVKPLAFVGRHTLLIYLLHQVIIFSVLQVIFYLV